MYNRKHGLSWPASPLGRARPSAIRRCSLPPPAPCLPFPPHPSHPPLQYQLFKGYQGQCSVYVCVLYVCTCVCRFMGIQYTVPLLQSLPPLLPCTSVGDPTVHPFPASTVGDPTVLAPPSLHVSWRSNGAFLPCYVCTSLLPSRPCFLLHVVAFLPLPARCRVLPTRWVGVGYPNTGNKDPAGSQEVVLPSLPLHFSSKASHNCSLPAVWLSGQPPILPCGQAGVQILPPPLINSTISNKVYSERTIRIVCICEYVLYVFVCCEWVCAGVYVCMRVYIPTRPYLPPTELLSMRYVCVYVLYVRVSHVPYYTTPILPMNPL